MRWRTARTSEQPAEQEQSPPRLGEYRQATILFADVEGFTALTEQLPAQEVVDFLNTHFTAMTEVVYHWGGHLDKYIGDAMLVVWDDREHPPAWGAQHAVQAALDMHREATQAQHHWLQQGRRPMKIRIGISSGVAIAGQIGSPRRRDLTVIGDVVNLAARLEALNKEFLTDTIISQPTYLLAGDRCQVRSLGKVQIKGRREPVEPFALLGWRASGPLHA